MPLSRRPQPDWIINCAAYNLVDKAESEPDKAMLINCTAVKNIHDAIRGSECRFIHISSDYVFNGKSNIPYNEYSATRSPECLWKVKTCRRKSCPLSSWINDHQDVMALFIIRSKFCQNNSEQGKRKRIAEVVFDQTGTPTYAADLAEAIMKIVSGVIRNQIAFIAGIYHYSNEGVCSWYDFAEAIVREAGIDCKVHPDIDKELSHSSSETGLFSS